jgi:predicted ATPase
MKIRFENFGNIKEGEIELKPLTVFIGPNNTGKTYCAYSIYGIFDYTPIYISGNIEDFKINELDDELENIIKESKERGYVKINME